MTTKSAVDVADRSSPGTISQLNNNQSTTSYTDQTALPSPQQNQGHRELSTPPVAGGQIRDRYVAFADWSKRKIPSTGVFGPTSYLAVLSESDDAVARSSSDLTLFAKSLQHNRSAIIDDGQIQLGSELLLILFDDLTLYERMATARFDHCQGDLFATPALRLIFSSIRKMLNEAISDKSNPLPDLVTLSNSIFAASSKPLNVDPNMSPVEYFTAMPNRWEIVGLIFSVIGSSACLLPRQELIGYSASSNSPLDRKSLAAVCVAAGEICLRFCENTGLITEQLCWVVLEHTSLLTLLYGDYDYRPWQTFGTLCTLIFALGFHQRESSAKLPFFLAEHRKRLLVSTYCMDKELSTFLGRPPRMIRRYTNIELPLDMTFEDIMAQPEVRDSAIARLDQDGWNAEGVCTRVSYARASFLMGSIRESVLELSMNPEIENLEEKISEIWSLAQKMRSDLPPTLWRIGSIEDFEREPEASKVSLCLHLDYLYNGFILQRILVQRTNKGPEKLINVAHELLSNLLLLIANRSSAGEDVNSIVWIISYVGLPSAGVLALELLRQFQNPHPYPLFPRSEIIQNLSRFAADLEHTVCRQAGNHEICQQARNVIRHILDRVLSGPPSGATMPHSNENAVEAAGNNTSNFVPMDWLAGDFNAWLDEDSDLMKWVNSFE
ncbi:uncharacterized protein N7498_006342 [Penicillium cinerascens]|uniref:Xylanolytic transcriptional activator regulatory domain-containing protein n=1 Tax=Penicillium cinerascens TaxID=70096 RepID=A0A9W9SX83_9EURO|nr:uncharacterized protein N7498_006342 [Penicillium cinerascens]KAJ5201679.1 hypothetical protein N7498_006342 [Penicillium cinerascens]